MLVTRALRTFTLAVVVAFAASIAPSVSRAQSTATLHGMVTDSVTRAPLSHATVVAIRSGSSHAGEAVSAESDKHGRFSMQLPAGQYQITAEHPALDSTSSAVIPASVELAEGGSAELTLATPSPATVRARACPGVALDSTMGAVIGRVDDARNGAAVPGATLVFQWDEIDAVPSARDLRARSHTVSVTANDAGFFAACGVPLQVPIRAQVQKGESESGVVDLMVSTRSVLARSFTIDPSVKISEAEARYTVRGSVAGPDGAPVARARVRIFGDTMETTTNENGDFRLSTRFAGSQVIEAVALGFTPGGAPVDVVATHEPFVSMRLEKFAVVLEAMRSTATLASGMLKHKEFEQRRNGKMGARITPELLEQRHPFQMSDLLRDLPRYRGSVPRTRYGIPPMQGGASGTSSYIDNAGSSFQACPDVYIDGLKDRSGQGINALPPDWVYGVELYQPGDGSPAKFHNRCGLILIWTK